MSLLYPDYWFGRITDIPASFFKKHGIQLIALDVDNTLTTHNCPDPAEGVEKWLEEMKSAGLTLFILSNNKAARVEPFAEKLGLPCVSSAAKPLPFELKKACVRFGSESSRCALIGDQLFTDILCGRLLHGLSLLVTLQEPEHGLFFRIKRKLEQPSLKHFRQRFPERIFVREK